MVKELEKLHDTLPFISEFKIENENISKDSIYEEDISKFSKDAYLVVLKVLG